MTPDRLRDELQSIATLALSELRDAWLRRWGEPPRFRSRDLMARAMAHKVQAAAFGDLPSPLRRRMKEHAVKFTIDRTFSPTAGPSLQPGSSLVREWHGSRHEVTVAESGFLYNGEAFGSLSQVARKITGVKWNGPVFFGVKTTGGKRP